MADNNIWLHFDEMCSLLGQKIKKNHNEGIKNLNNLFLDDNEGRYSKRKIIKFLEIHVSLKSVVEELQIIVYEAFGSKNAKSFNSFLIKTLRDLSIDVIKFSNSYESRFIKRDNFEQLKQYLKKIYRHQDTKICIQKDFQLELQLGRGHDYRSKVNAIFKQYNIKPYFSDSRMEFYKKTDLESLKIEQKKQLQILDENYITINEACKIHNIQRDNLTNFLNRNDLSHHKVQVPLLCSILTETKNYKSNTMLLPKHLVQKYLNYLNEKKDIEIILSKCEKMPYQCFQKLLKYYQVDFQKEIILSNKYWYSFVKLKIEETIKSGIALKEFITMLFSITKLLVKFCNKQELFSFSEKELALALFNNRVPNQWQRQIYNFLNRLNYTLELNKIKVLNMMLIPNPKHKNTVYKEKETYSVNEFINLIDYCNESFHRVYALADSKTLLQGKKSNNYSNMWLYTIILLNNAWRHSDVIAFPRLTIPQFDHLTLDWLENNELSLSDAELIADFYRNNPFIHSKNGMKRYFIISDELLLSFANAVAVCECVHREFYPLSDRILGFKNKAERILESVHNNFFAKYKRISEDFEFKSSIINRTVISLGTDIISKLSNGNSIDAIKFFRRHTNIEITNIYIDIPSEYLNRIADHLFNLGNFGYIYESLSALLFGEINQRENSTKLHDLFNSLERIESIAHCALVLSSEKEQVSEYIGSLSKEEAYEKYNLLKWGLSPSKSSNMQCLVGLENCPMGIMECDKCSLMVPNRFTLCNLNLQFINNIESFIATYQYTDIEGEKVKVSNQLYMTYDLLKQAVHYFGRETVLHFIDLDSINKIMKNLPSFKQHISIIEQAEE